MLADPEKSIPISDANKNFSLVARQVDESGAVVITRNNKPAYVVISYPSIRESERVGNEDVLAVARHYLDDHRAAFEALAR
jgi:antitoxin Phd